MHIGALCQLLFGILKRTQIVIHYENTILEYIDITGNTVTASTSGKPVRIQAVARASAIIDVIANAGEEGVGLSEISRVTELNKTTAFNLLASLVALRFLEQDEHSRRYRLGLRNLELGRIVQQRLHI